MSGLQTKPLPLYREDVEQALLRISGVTGVQMFTKLLVRCEFPMADETIIALQEAQDWIEHETGWKVEMTVSAGKRPEARPTTANEPPWKLMGAEFYSAQWQKD